MGFITSLNMLLWILKNFRKFSPIADKIQWNFKYYFEEILGKFWRNLIQIIWRHLKNCERISEKYQDVIFNQIKQILWKFVRRISDINFYQEDFRNILRIPTSLLTSPVRQIAHSWIFSALLPLFFFTNYAHWFSFWLVKMDSKVITRVVR